jgi:hypothetical protein
MVESLLNFKLDMLNVGFYSREKAFTEGDTFCFKLKPGDKKDDKDDAGVIKGYFDKHHFIPIPSVSLDTSSLSSSSVPSVPSSVVMGGRNLCSLMHGDITCGQPPKTVTYDRNVALNEIGFII